MGLAFEGEFGEIVNLGEKIQGKVWLPEPNFIALVKKNLFEPWLQVHEVEFAFGVCD